MPEATPTFRVHFADGTKLDIPAGTAKAAGEMAGRQHDGQIRKIKIIRR